MNDLAEFSYATVAAIRGPLLELDGSWSARIGEAVTIFPPEGEPRQGEVLRIAGDTVLIQVFGETRGLDLEQTRAFLSGLNPREVVAVDE